MMHAIRHLERGRIECNCGWSADVPISDIAAAQREARALFVEHLPADQRRRGVKVDARPGFEAAWLLPEREPVGFEPAGPQNGIHYVRITGGELLPVLEVVTVDGRVFKVD